MKSFSLFGVAIAILASGIGLTSCDNKDNDGKDAQEGAIYTVRKITEQTITLPTDYPATIKGKLDVEIRPQIAGVITKVLVDEGAKVRRGQALFQLDQVQFAEAVNAAKAAVAVAESQVATAELTAKNNRQLASEAIIGDYALQASENQLATAKATLASANAQLTSAQKQLSFTTVVSPTDGVVGNIPFRAGSLVSPQMPQPLTSVSDISEVYAQFALTERQYLALASQDGEKGLADKSNIELKLLDGSTYPYKGELKTVSGVLNATTGTLNVRVLFPNPNGTLLSGATAKVVLPDVIEKGIEVPQLATFQLQKNTFVYVVDEQGIVTARQIEIYPQHDGLNYVVTDGLSAGDVIVLDGVVTLKEGMTINYQDENK